MHCYSARKAFERLSCEFDVLLVSNVSLAAPVWRGIEYLLLRLLFMDSHSGSAHPVHSMFELWWRCEEKKLRVAYTVVLMWLMWPSATHYIILQHSGWIESLQSGSVFTWHLMKCTYTYTSFMFTVPLMASELTSMASLWGALQRNVLISISEVQ